MVTGRKQKANRLPYLFQNRKVVFISLLIGAVVLVGIFGITGVEFASYSAFDWGTVSMTGADDSGGSYVRDLSYFETQPFFAEVWRIEFFPNTYTINNRDPLAKCEFILDEVDVDGNFIETIKTGTLWRWSGVPGIGYERVWTGSVLTGAYYRLHMTFEGKYGDTTEIDEIFDRGLEGDGERPVVSVVITPIDIDSGTEPLMSIHAEDASAIDRVKIRWRHGIPADYIWSDYIEVTTDGPEIVQVGTHDFEYTFPHFPAGETVQYVVWAWDVFGFGSSYTGEYIIGVDNLPVITSLDIMVDGDELLITASAWDDSGADYVAIWLYWYTVLGTWTSPTENGLMDWVIDIDFEYRMSMPVEGSTFYYRIVVYEGTGSGRSTSTDYVSFEIGNAPPIIVEGLAIDGHIFEYGDTTQYNYTFRATDAEPGAFGIESNIDGMLFSGSYWLSDFDMPFYFKPKHGLDYWSVGVHKITLWVEDVDGLRAEEEYTISISDGTVPAISRPEDINYEKLTPNFFPEIVWSVYDESHGYFEIHRNNELFDTYDWVYHTEVRVPVWEWPVGGYAVVLTAYDGNGNYAQDTVGVTITGASDDDEDTTPPSVAGPADESYELGSMGNKIVWQAGDANPAFYILTMDGEEVISGSWDGSDIEHSLDGLAVGSYTFKLQLEDISGLITEDMVTISIYKIGEKPTLPSEPKLEDTTTGILIIGVVLVIIIFSSSKRRS